MSTNHGPTSPAPATAAAEPTVRSAGTAARRSPRFRSATSPRHDTDAVSRRGRADQADVGERCPEPGARRSAVSGAAAAVRAASALRAAGSRIRRVDVRAAAPGGPYAQAQPCRAAPALRGGSELYGQVQPYGYGLYQPYGMAYILEHPRSGTILTLGVELLIPITAPPGVWHFGARAKRDIAEGAPYRYGGTARAGEIIGIVMTILQALFWLLVFMGLFTS